MHSQHNHSNSYYDLHQVRFFPVFGFFFTKFKHNYPISIFRMCRNCLAFVAGRIFCEDVVPFILSAPHTAKQNEKTNDHNNSGSDADD